MKIDGRCYCGQVTFEAEVDPAHARLCNCTDCQVMGGSAFRWVIRSEVGTFKILSGTPTVFVKTAESGNERPHGFCATCGTAIYSTTVGPEPKVYSVRVGAIAQRDQLRPHGQIWTRSAQAWVADIAGLPGSEQG